MPLALAVPAHAHRAPALTGSRKEIAVTATRIEADAASVPAITTALERATPDRRTARDEAGLIRDEPDMTLARQPHGAPVSRATGLGE